MGMKYFDMLLRFHHRRSSHTYRALSLFVGAIFFLVILPVVFFLLGEALNRFITIDLSEEYILPVGILSVVFGLFFLVWATITQLTLGGGTPAPNAPTQKLVIRGPYRHTRNPIEFGALFYYLGIGILFGSLFHGLICMLLGLIFGSSYHKFIEEKELLLRFGEEYINYRNLTPFLIPHFWKYNANKGIDRAR